jgi:terminase small subunit / prophage DNA-packing protein
MIEVSFVSASDLGVYLGISGRAVREHAANGVLTKNKKGRYRIPDAIIQYCSHFRDLAAGKGGAGVAVATATERTRLLRAQAAAQEAKNAQIIGSMLDAAEVDRTWSDIVRQSRAAVLAVPARCQQRLPHLTTHDVKELDLELREALRALGEGGADGAA